MFRQHHQYIVELLNALDSQFLRRTQCYFGGGTQLVLLRDEYRESRDIDFLCASQEGYRQLRETITQNSLGKLARKPIKLAREIRADRDGIRTFFLVDKTPIKFEIVREARIPIRGRMNQKLAVPCLTIESAIAEKLLANADRGFDSSTYLRDLIDLAFVAASPGIRRTNLRAGFKLAQSAYGVAVKKHLQQSVARAHDQPLLKKCMAILGITDIATLERGLRKLELLSE